MDDFYFKVIKTFNENEVRYLVIGGFAVNFYGYNRTTSDLDMWISLEESNLTNLKSAIASLGFDFSDAAMNEIREEKIVSFSEGDCVVELLSRINISQDISFDEAFERSELRILNEVKFYLISIEDLKKEKAKSKRYKDLDDLSKLEEAEAYYIKKSKEE
jgi:predicted nucleotidyltransferase